jgi:thymidylate synthase
MNNYLRLMKDIMNYGEDRQGRNAVTRALFAEQLKWDLREGFPLVTTKKVPFKSVVGELLWFLSGSTNDTMLRGIMDYPADKPTIWTANAEDPKWKPKATMIGDLGRIYGKQWRSWRGVQWTDGKEEVVFIDQLANIVKRIEQDPFDRRLIVTAWNPADLDEMALPACHVMFQLFCGADKTLSLSMVQRSCDYFLGVPFNIASYALLLSLVAHVTGRQAKILSILFQDVHLYHEHFQAVETQVNREPHALPTLELNPQIVDLFEFGMDDIVLRGYESDESIKAEMIV